MHRDEEQLLIIKTQDSLVSKLTQVVKANHPYDDPEVVSVPITGGSNSYIAWVKETTT